MAQPAPAPARLTLDNGDVLSGTVESLEGDQVFFRTEFGTLTIPVARVRNLESQREPVQRRWRELRDARLRPTVTHPSPAEIEFEHPEVLGPDSLLRRKKAMLAERSIFQRAREAVSWTGSFAVETAFIDGASQRREYYGETRNTWTIFGRDRLNLDGEFERDTVDDVRVIDRYFVTTSYDRFLNERLFLSPLYETERNSLTATRRSDLFALRLGYIAFSDEAHNLEIQAGPAFRYERLADGGRRETGGATWSVDYDLNLRSLLDGLTFFHEQTGTLDLREQPGRRRITTDTGLRYTFFGGFFLAGVLEFDYDSHTAGGDESVERTYRMNLGYSW